MIHSLVFIVALLMVVLTMPQIIEIAVKRHLFDSPNEARKIHTRQVPNLGGIALFTGFLFTSVIFIRPDELPQANLILAAGILVFMVGVRDDLVGTTPAVKFGVQFISAIVIAYFAGLSIPLTNYAITVGQGQVDLIFGVIITVVFIVGAINAYNLTDGIDCLCGLQGLLGAVTFAVLFYLQGEHGWSVISLALAGSICGFLAFNITPARVFLGDSGSLLMGFLISILAIKFLGLSILNVVHVGSLRIDSPLGLVGAVMIVPIFDTLRVFSLRAIKRTSPFKADKNHMHHRMLHVGFTHLQASGLLGLVTVIFIIIALLLQHIGNIQLLSLMFFLALLCNSLFTLYIKRYDERAAAGTDSENEAAADFQL